MKYTKEQAEKAFRISLENGLFPDYDTMSDEEKECSKKAFVLGFLQPVEEFMPKATNSEASSN